MPVLHTEPGRSPPGNMDSIVHEKTTREGIISAQCLAKEKLDMQGCCLPKIANNKQKRAYTICFVSIKESKLLSHHQQRLRESNCPKKIAYRIHVLHTSRSQFTFSVYVAYVTQHIGPTIKKIPITDTAIAQHIFSLFSILHQEIKESGLVVDGTMTNVDNIK